MSPKKKKKIHETHFDDVSTTVRFGKIPIKRGIKKFSIQAVDLCNILDWECNNYEEVYN